MTRDDTLPIFIFEPRREAREEAAAAIAAAGHEALVASTPEQATATLEGARLAAILLPATAAGVEIAEYIKDFSGVDAPMAVVVEPDEEAPAQQVDKVGAAAHLRRPISAGAIELFVQLAPQVAELRQLLARAPQEGRPTGTTATRTGFHHFEDVKDLLVVEVRRAKRYGYPLSLLLIRLDPIPAFQQIERPGLPREITAGLAVAIARSVRVIDLPIHYAADSILVFLPHTDLAGAEEVGRRIKRRIKRITYRDDALMCQLTASVGVAGISAGDNLTFSKLIKNAASALRAAQLKGGDRVMKRTPNPTTRLEAIQTSTSREVRVDVDVPVDDIPPVGDIPPVDDIEGAEEFDGGPTLSASDGLATRDTLVSGGAEPSRGKRR